MENVEIVGAGIGGLTLAVALRQSGIPCSVHERASAPPDAGTGIILALNAMQVLARLGLRGQIEKASARCAAMDVADTGLRLLNRIDLAGYEGTFGTTARAIHRAELQRVLIEALPEGTVQFDRELVDITVADSGANLTFASGESLESSCLIGADGIGSVIRSSCFAGTRVVPSGQTCWRGITRTALPPALAGRLTEVWARSGRLGFVAISESEVYWYVVVTNGAGFEGVRRELCPANPWIAELLPEGSEDAAHHAEIADLQMDGPWQNGPVCLIGDAAHAVTPNLGQGGCQAIEDAWVLSRLLARGKDPQEAFAGFCQTRRRKVADVAARSRALGRVSHWTNPVASVVRNGLMRMMPEAANDAFLTRLYTLEMD